MFDDPKINTLFIAYMLKILYDIKKIIHGAIIVRFLSLISTEMELII